MAAEVLVVSAHDIAERRQAALVLSFPRGRGAEQGERADGRVQPQAIIVIEKADPNDQGSSIRLGV